MSGAEAGLNTLRGGGGIAYIYMYNIKFISPWRAKFKANLIRQGARKQLKVYNFA